MVGTLTTCGMSQNLARPARDILQIIGFFCRRSRFREFVSQSFSFSHQIDECLNRRIGCVVGGFDLRGKRGGRGGPMVKERVGEGTADALVEQDEHRGDLDVFLGEPVAIPSAFPLEQWVRLFCI